MVFPDCNGSPICCPTDGARRIPEHAAPTPKGSPACAADLLDAAPCRPGSATSTVVAIHPACEIDPIAAAADLRGDRAPIILCIPGAIIAHARLSIAKVSSETFTPAPEATVFETTSAERAQRKCVPGEVVRTPRRPSTTRIPDTNGCTNVRFNTAPVAEHSTSRVSPTPGRACRGVDATLRDPARKGATECQALPRRNRVGVDRSRLATQLGIGLSVPKKQIALSAPAEPHMVAPTNPAGVV